MTHSYLPSILFLSKTDFLSSNKNSLVLQTYTSYDKGTRINPLDWSTATAKEPGLTRKDMFQSAPRGSKPIQIPKRKA